MNSVFQTEGDITFVQIFCDFIEQTDIAFWRFIFLYMFGSMG